MNLDALRGWGPVVEMPKAAPSTIKRFEALTPDLPGVTSKKIFGQPAAFLNGNMFLGVFGETVFVRLSPDDRLEAKKIPGFRPFEPMPGRAMSEYLVFPKTMDSPGEAGKWVDRSIRYVSRLPVKRPKVKAR
jgi:hypothetical protein